MIKKFFNPLYMLSAFVIAAGTLIGQYAAIQEWKEETTELKELSDKNSEQ